MRLDLVCAAASRDNGKPTQLAGCGVIVRLTDSHKRVQTREFGWALGGSTANLAEIMAARLALSSVLPQFRGYTARLFISSRYVDDLLKMDGQHFVVSPSKNKQEVEELRRWYGYYKDIAVYRYNRYTDRSDVGVLAECIVRAKELANRALESQEHFDSGTTGLNDAAP